MASINLAVVYGEIQKLATNGGEPGAARSRIDLFQNDVAGLDPSERAEYLSRLREILVTAGQRHPGGSAHDTFQEAINVSLKRQIEARGKTDEGAAPRSRTAIS